MEKIDRAWDELRPVKITRGFTEIPGGSVLWEQGKTVVWCTASVTQELPPWFSEDRAGGWITAEYVMLPPSTPQRKSWPKIGHTDSRGTEIQRIVGRSLRAIIDLSKIGPHTIAIDCQVLQADGGTRTAAICGGYVALADALAKLPREMPIVKKGSGVKGQDSGGEGVAARYDPTFYDPAKALVDEMAAVSVGVVEGKVYLDLDYALDSEAQVDFNIAYTGRGKFVEVQGSAENGEGFDRGMMDRLLDLAVKGCGELMGKMREGLERR